MINDTGRLTPPVSERDHIRGERTTPVELVEYGDYQCPDCGRTYPVVKDLLKTAGQRVHFVFRNFPLTEVHAHAEHAAEVAEAAAAQGKFWEMNDALFEHQQTLEDGHLREYAKALGLDMEQFDKEMSERVHIKRVEEDLTSGLESGVEGTPTFFINGVLYNGPDDLQSLLRAIG